MKIDYKELPKSQAEITIELTPQEFDPFLKKAALDISEKVKISGFRPGKAPYDIIKQQVGELALWQEALEGGVKKTLFQAIEEKKLTTVGSPKIDIMKLVPGNPVIYKATLYLMPTVGKLVIDGIKVSKKSIKVEDKDVEKTLDGLRKMRSKEKLVRRPAKKGDRVDVDFKIFLDRIPVDGGDGKKMPVTLGENKFIPGFEEKLIEMKEGEEKEFALTFPKEYYQKNLAGKLVDFKVKVLGVYEIELPAIDDEFAKSLRFNDADDLKKNIRENMIREFTLKEERRVEEEMMDKILEKNRFTDIPEILLHAEAKSMMEEFEQGIKNDGISFDDYLMHIKKTREQLLLEFTAPALRRIKIAIFLRELAKSQNISVSPEEVDRGILDAQKENVAQEDLSKNTEYRNYFFNILTTRKVMDFLKQKIVQ